MIDTIMLNKDKRTVTIIYATRAPMCITGLDLRHTLDLLDNLLNWSDFFQWQDDCAEVTQVGAA